MDVRAILSQALRGDPSRIALEFKGTRIDCAALSVLIDALNILLQEAGIPDNAPVALVARNRPGTAAALIGLVEAGRTVSNLYAFQSPQALAADIIRSRFMVIIADEEDWTPEVTAAAGQTGSLGLMLRWGAPAPIVAMPGLEKPGVHPFRDPLKDPGLKFFRAARPGNRSESQSPTACS